MKAGPTDADGAALAVCFCQSRDGAGGPGRVRGAVCMVVVVDDGEDAPIHCGMVRLLHDCLGLELDRGGGDLVR